LLTLWCREIIATMARWFPSGLSALSGQISNFTKEVLAEGIEEIDGTFKNHAYFRDVDVDVDRFDERRPKPLCPHLEITLQ